MPKMNAWVIGGIVIAVIIVVIIAVFYFSQPAQPSPPPFTPPPLPLPPPPVVNIPPPSLPTPQPESSTTDEGSGEAPGSYTKFERSWASWLDCRNHPNFKSVGLSPTICTVDRDKLKATCDSIPACFAYGFPDTTAGAWNNTGALFQFSSINPKNDWRIWAKDSYL